MLYRMSATTSDAVEPVIRRRVFASWSIEMPPNLTEAYVSDGGYWHAYGDDRSISVSSINLTDRGRPVPARLILQQVPPSEGVPVMVMPPGVSGWAVTRAAPPNPVGAARMLSGMLATDGHVAIVTITTDDLAWALDVWQSIRHHSDGAPLAPRDDACRRTSRGFHRRSA
jgi:hypothetical protein